MILFALVALVAVTGAVEIAKVPYSKLDYFQIREQLEALAKQYPGVMQLENATEKLGVPYLVECDAAGTQKCVIDIVTITDVSVSSLDKVQLIVTGSLNGQDRLGPQVAYYLIEYLVTNFGADFQITQLLQKREIVIVPIPNAWGFANNKEKELAKYKTSPTSTTMQYLYKDAFRDFPYN